MIILGIESSGLTAGVALLEDDILRAEFTVDNLLTHSHTLMPMIREVFKLSTLAEANVDAIAVSSGPGSFTGLRIGAASAKGLAFALDRPLVPVPTLQAMGLIPSRTSDMVVCPLMNARRSETYAAAFYRGEILVPEGAYGIDSYLSLLSGEKFLFLGDGVEVFRDRIEESLGGRASYADASLSRQRAAHVAILGRELLAAGGGIKGDDFVPVYFRKPRAERELEAGRLRDAGKASLDKIARGL